MSELPLYPPPPSVSAALPPPRLQLNVGLLLRMSGFGRVFPHPTFWGAAPMPIERSEASMTSWGGALSPTVAWSLLNRRRPRPCS